LLLLASALNENDEQGGGEEKRKDDEGTKKKLLRKAAKSSYFRSVSEMKYVFLRRPGVGGWGGEEDKQKVLFGGRQRRKIVCGTFDTLLLYDARLILSPSAHSLSAIHGYYVFNTFMIHHKSGCIRAHPSALSSLIPLPASVSALEERRLRSFVDVEFHKSRLNIHKIPLQVSAPPPPFSASSEREYLFADVVVFTLSHGERRARRLW
jgi:hypothetical protein